MSKYYDSDLAIVLVLLSPLILMALGISIAMVIATLGRCL